MGFSEDEIRSQQATVIHAVKHLATMRLEVLDRSASSLDDFLSVTQPLRLKPDILSKYMTTFSLMKQQHINNGVWSSILRQRIILHEYRIARTVLDIENVLCQEIFGRGTFLSNPENWIERVLRDIHIRLVLQQHIVLSSHSYIDAIGFSPVVFSKPDWTQKERA